MIKRLRHWLIEARKKKCHHCCLWCEYWDICRWDIPEKHGWIDIADDLPEPETLVLLSFEECDHTEVGQRIIYDDGNLYMFHLLCPVLSVLLPDRLFSDYL